MKRKYIFLWCASFLAAGIFFASFFEFSLFGGGLFLFLSLMGILSGRVFGKTGVVWVCGALFLCAAGAVRMEMAEEIWRQQSQYIVGSEGTFCGIVAEEPLVYKGEDGYTRYLIDLRKIRYADGEEKSISGTVYLYDFAVENKYPVGTALEAEGKLRPLRLYKNPGKIDLEKRYESGHLLGRIYSKENSRIRPVGETGEYRVTRWAETMRERLACFFASYMDPVRLPVLMTLLFGGHYSEIPKDIIHSFSVTGIIHILSVSGSHIALLFGFLYFLGKWLGLSMKVTVVPAVLLVLVYAAMSGFVPPVIRASLMGILAVIGVLLERGRTALNLLGAAVAGMLLWNPYFLFDISFQLSVCASAGILLFYEPLRHALARLGKIPPRICEGCALSTAAQILVLPIILYNFHSFPLYFIPANLIVVPLLEWVIIGGLLAALSSFLLMPLAGGILQFADYFLWAALRLNGFISSLPEASFEAGSLSLAEGILYYIGVAVFCFKRKWERKGQYLLAGVIFAGAILLLAEWAAHREIVLLAPDLGADTGTVLMSGDAKIVYYKSSGIPSAASGRELDSILGYHGIFDIDVLLLNLEEVKKPVPFEMDTRIKEIWAVGGKAETLAPFLIKDFKGTVRNLSPSRLRLKNGLTVITNGSALRVGKGSWDVYFAGNKSFNEGDSPHTAWVGGSNGFRRGVSEKELGRLRPEAAVYGGGGRFVGEDKDVFYLCNCPVAYTESEGMAELIWEKDGWRLLRGRWDGNNGSKTNLIQLQNFIR